MATYFLQISLNSLVEAMQVMLLATGLLISYSVSKLMNLGIGAAFTIGAYSYYTGLQQGGVSEALLLFACSLFLLTLVNIKLLEPFIQKNLDLMGLLSSIALWFFVQELHVLVFGPQGKYIIQGVLPTLELAGLHLTWAALWTIGVSSILAAFSAVTLLHTPIGRSVRAIKLHAPSSAQLGINGKSVRKWAFFMALILGGLVGVFSGMNTAMTPMSSHTLIIPAFLAFLVGGKVVKGVFIAALLLVLIPSLLVSSPLWGGAVNEAFKPAIIFILSTLLLVLRPNGLLAIQTRTN